MRRLFARSCLLGALGLAACSSWTGPQKGGTPVTETGNVTEGDGGVPELDGGERPVADGGDGAADGGDTDGGDGDTDGGRTSPLGDDRAGFEHCGARSCGAESICCASPEGTGWCDPQCGLTVSSIGCDGPEDCEDSQVCCHEFVEGVVRGQCMEAETAASDAGPASRACATQPDGPTQLVACHTDDDCSAEIGTRFCRAGAASGELTLGYCKAETDEPSTPGHDDIGFVGCGDPDDDGVGTSCELETAICCLSRSRPNVAACGDIAACGQSETRVGCDGPEDCGGQICCQLPAREVHDGVKPPSIECAERCDAPGAITRCHSAADCPQRSVCERDRTSPWWGTCVPS